VNRSTSFSSPLMALTFSNFSSLIIEGTVAAAS
jgi:hypothetical protein